VLRLVPVTVAKEKAALFKREQGLACGQWVVSECRRMAVFVCPLTEWKARPIPIGSR